MKHSEVAVSRKSVCVCAVCNIYYNFSGAENNPRDPDFLPWIQLGFKEKHTKTRRKGLVRGGGWQLCYTGPRKPLGGHRSAATEQPVLGATWRPDAWHVDMGLGLVGT